MPRLYRSANAFNQRPRQLAVALLGAAGVAAFMAWAPLPVEPPLPSRASAAAAAAQTAVSTSMQASTASGPARRIYPHSIIPGGVASREELARVIATDKVVAAHYAGFDVDKAVAVTVTEPRAVYVSYRKGDQVYWTSKKLMLAVGETLFTDGRNEMRARCANRISDLPMLPVAAHGEPSAEELEAPLAAEGEGSIQDIAADAVGDTEFSGQPFQLQTFANGAGLITPAMLAAANAAPGALPDWRALGGTLGGGQLPIHGGQLGSAGSTGVGTSTDTSTGTEAGADPLPPGTGADQGGKDTAGPLPKPLPETGTSPPPAGPSGRPDIPNPGPPRAELPGLLPEPGTEKDPAPFTPQPDLDGPRGPEADTGLVDERAEVPEPASACLAAVALAAMLLARRRARGKSS